MKRLFSLICSYILITTCMFADVSASCNKKDSSHKIHNHNTYKLCYNSKTLCPDYVIWTLTEGQALLSEELNQRTNNFRPCEGTASVNDYKNSGYDKGHMCPNNDRDYDKECASETFLLCNMCPQLHSMNAGPWLKLERLGHTLAKEFGYIEIISGPIFTGSSKTIGNGKVRVPDKFFKVFYNGDFNFIECYILNHEDKIVPAPVDIREIEELTGISFTFN